MLLQCWLTQQWSQRILQSTDHWAGWRTMLSQMQGNQWFLFSEQEYFQLFCGQNSLWLNKLLKWKFLFKSFFSQVSIESLGAAQKVRFRLKLNFGSFLVTATFWEVAVTHRVSLPHFLPILTEQPCVHWGRLPRFLKLPSCSSKLNNQDT